MQDAFCGCRNASHCHLKQSWTYQDDHNPGHSLQSLLILLACEGIQKHKRAMYTKGIDVKQNWKSIDSFAADRRSVSINVGFNIVVWRLFSHSNNIPEVILHRGHWQFLPFKQDWPIRKFQLRSTETSINNYFSKSLSNSWSTRGINRRDDDISHFKDYVLLLRSFQLWTR